MGIKDKHRVVKQFQWREISQDGLLKEPKEVGPYYDTVCLDGTYDSEEEALADLESKKSYYGHSTFVLTTIYYVNVDYK